MLLEELQLKIASLKGKRDSIQDRKTQLIESLDRHNRQLLLIENAKQIVHTVALKTQRQVEIHISDLVSTALSSVFPEPYKMVLEFVVRRDKTEADLLFSKGDSQVDPLSSSGGGPIDVASFALRVALWSLEGSKTRRPVLILDEPFRFVSRNLQDRVGLMLKELSTRLGLQFIIVTHEEKLTEIADRSFHVSIKNGVSEVTA